MQEEPNSNGGRTKRRERESESLKERCRETRMGGGHSWGRDNFEHISCKKHLPILAEQLEQIVPLNVPRVLFRVDLSRTALVCVSPLDLYNCVC